jgi:pilus assembly protein CpaD
MTDEAAPAAPCGAIIERETSMSRKPALPSLKAARLGALSFAGAAALSLAGCGTDYVATSIAPDDYHERHPIVLSQSPTALDVFPVGAGKLDPQSIDDIRVFAARYRSMGNGRIIILAPSVGGYQTRANVDEIRRVLVAAGLSGSVGLGSYPVADASLASPIRLSFRGLKAEVPSRCGQWPRDIASGTSTETWKNESYWNFGCATQAMLAAQVDDPRDFARARALGPVDEEMRLRAIKAVREGSDPGTKWETKLTTIGEVGGN